VSLPDEDPFGLGTTDEPARPRRIGVHPVDPVSLVAGLLAVAVALLSLLELDVDAGVVVPLVLVGAGLVGLVAAVRRGGD
jgi:hypothetical protein